MNEAFANIPGYRNGETSWNKIQFSIGTVPEKFPEACEHMADVLEIREFDEEIIRAEKALLAVEMRGAGDDHWAQAMRFLLGGKHWSLPRGGLEKSFTKISNDSIHEFQRWVFCPARIVVVIAGSFAETDTDSARRSFGRLANGCIAPSQPFPKLPHLPVIRRVPNISGRSGVLLMFAVGQLATHLEYNCLNFLWYALLHESSPLFDEIRYGHASLYHVYCSPYTVADHWLIPIYAFANRKEQHWFVDSVCRFLKSVCNGDIQQGWFEQARDSLIHSYLDAMHDPEIIANSVAFAEAVFPENLRSTFDEDVRTLRTLQPSDVVALARKTFRLDNLLVQRTRHLWQTDRHIRRAISILA